MARHSKYCNCATCIRDTKELNELAAKRILERAARQARGSKGKSKGKSGKQGKPGTSNWQPAGGQPPDVGVVGYSGHVASFKTGVTGGPKDNQTLVRDGDYSDDARGFDRSPDGSKNHNHYGSAAEGGFIDKTEAITPARTPSTAPKGGTTPPFGTKLNGINSRYMKQLNPSQKRTKELTSLARVLHDVILNEKDTQWLKLYQDLVVKSKILFNKSNEPLLIDIGANLNQAIKYKVEGEAWYPGYCRDALDAIEVLENDSTAKPPKFKLNDDLEIALVKIARVIYEYAKTQNNPAELNRLTPLLSVFWDIAREYTATTNSFSEDLSLELSEWIDFKDIFLNVPQEQQVKNAKTNKGPSGINKHLVDKMGQEVLHIIENLEADLGVQK